MQGNNDIKGVDKLINEDFSGAVCISQKGSIVFEKAYGFADISNQVPNKISTRFQTASGCKVFTAVAVLQLIEKQLIGLDTTIADVLDFDLHDTDPKVTIRQLLNHTSGVPDYFDESIMNDYDELWIDYPNYKIRTLSDLLPLFITKPMMYAAGERFQYNNSGYVLLGLAVEKVSGMQFDKYVEKNILLPCGMKDTGYFEFDRLPAGCAAGYIYDEESNTYRSNIYSVDVKGGSAGGAFTTVHDIKRFWESMLSFGLLSEGTTKQMLSPQAEDEYDTYGFGVWLKKNGKGGYDPFIQGSDPGVSFYSFVDAEAGVIGTIVSNIHNDVWKFDDDIIRILQS